ncbi:MAG: M50 family metallopeptidase [Clostridia bacterium]|nr:M50 family metallopeptidase [Clostridia bacterium]
MGKIRIKFHWSFWIFAFLLIYFKSYVLLVSMVLSVVLHEIGHYIVAKKLGYSLNVINLMPYGASLSGEDIYLEPKHEFFIALAGPLTSLLVGIIFMAIWWVIPKSYNYTSTFVYSNLSIFLVNFIPCYPLDGARILKSALKKRYSQKKVSMISKLVSYIAIISLTILYLISCFTHINYSLCLFVMFLLSGLLFSEDTEKYSLRSRTFRAKNTKKGVAVNIKAISNQSNILELYKILEPSSLNYILVLDKLNNTTMVLKDDEIEKLLTNYPLDTILKDIKGNIK